MPFDPFAASTTTTGSGELSLASFSDGIIKRAAKRTVVNDVDNGWRVSSLPGEKMNGYYVTSGPWHCSCWGLDHGDTRKRLGCSHVAAVMLKMTNGQEFNHVPEADFYQDSLDDFLEIDTLGNSDTNDVGTDHPIYAEHTVPTILIPKPDDDRFVGYDKTPLPSWVKEFRPHQWEATQQVVEQFNDSDIVWLDAPTGSGKTLIAELVRRIMGVDSFYVCTTKSLQDQFSRDFSYSEILKGRSNYPTLTMPYPDYTAADCTKSGGSEDSCYWCPVISDCEYERAKSKTLASKLGILNTSYLLTEGNYVGHVRGRSLNIIDECDTLESELMNFVQYEVSERRLSKLGLSAPKKGVRKKTILDWMSEELAPQIMGYIRTIPHGSDVQAIRERQSYTTLLQDTRRIIEDLATELLVGNVEDDSASNWIRDNDAGPLVMKPVRVGHYGSMVWGLGEKWLCMSATIISSTEMDKSLGVGDLGLQSSTVTVPMMFPVENRRIITAPMVSMTYQNQEDSWPIMAQAVKRVMEKHPDERILVHTVSYKLSNYLMRQLRSSRCVTYTKSDEKEAALERYRRNPGSVLFASSMDRGVDLKDDDCRVVVITKVPFPSLGDRQVSMRMRGKGGQDWYNVQTVRKLVQMTGRGVRSENDWCVTYIFDQMFLSKIWKKCKGLLPSWWRDAVEIKRTREFE